MKSETPNSILKDVAKIIDSRGDTHGNYVNQHRCAAQMISAYLTPIVGTQVELGPSEVAIILALVKISRSAHGDHSNLDHYSDLAGYAAIAGATRDAP